MLLFLISISLGILSGTLTGLTPGIHINLLMVLIPLSSISAPTTILASFIISLAITHTFIDLIPSIYLGAPDEDTGLSTLPGHKFLVSGQGHKALVLTLFGSGIAVFILLLITPFLFLIPLIYSFIQRMLGWFLIQISILLIYLEKGLRVNSFTIFLLSGFLGIATLNLPLKEPLLPLLTGLFGTSTLIYSIKTKTKVPKQIIDKVSIQKREFIRPSLATAIASPFCSFFPGLGSSQAAIIGSRIIGKLNKNQFMILLGSVNTLVMAVSFITFSLIGKTRTGAANALSQTMEISISKIPLIISIILLTTIISFPLTFYLSRQFARNIHKINYSKISLFITFFLTTIIFLFSGLLGVAILIISTIVGLNCMEFKVRKGFLMGSLLIPTTLFCLPF